VQESYTPKVVHFTSGHRAFDTRVFHKECKSLCQAGYQVVLVVPHNRDQIAAGIQVKAAPLPRSRLERFTSAPIHIYREALRQDGDVYHFHDPELVPAALFLRLHKKRVIYDVHDDTPATFADKEYIPRGLRPLLSWLSRVLENAAAQCFSAIIAATPAIAERFALLNEKTVVIENFALLDELPQGNVDWHERDRSVAFVGGLSRERGMNQMIQAMSLLPRSIPARLTFAGWFLPQSLREEAIHTPGWERVDDLGLMRQSAVAELLKRSRAGVLTFHPGANHSRAMPTKLFEYMSASIPVIASDFPLWRSLVDEAGCGLLVNPLQPREIASAIEFLMTHDKEAEEMGKRGRAAVEQLYNWTAQKGKLLDLYASLVGAPTRRMGRISRMISGEPLKP
jgi:glycosyltransferase involved in cell wall biosynthesis